MEMQHRWGTSTKRLEVATYLDRKYWKHETESDNNNKWQWKRGATTTAVTSGVTRLYEEVRRGFNNNEEQNHEVSLTGRKHKPFHFTD